MNNQIIILLLFIIALVATLYLYIWKAKKGMQYKNDERWLRILSKGSDAANFTTWLLIVVIAIGTTATIFVDTLPIFTLREVLNFGLYYVGLRNVIEIVALKIYDKNM